MFSAATLLRLYPRHWRDKYGDEFLATAGGERLPLRQAVDIISGAVDARFSSEVREATGAAAQHTQGVTAGSSVSICKPQRYTKRDGVIGAAVMLSGSAAFALLGIAAKLNGWPVVASLSRDLGFVAALMLSMPFWITKGQSWLVQVLVIGGTLAALALVSYRNV